MLSLEGNLINHLEILRASFERNVNMYFSGDNLDSYFCFNGSTALCMNTQRERRRMQYRKFNNFSNFSLQMPPFNFQFYIVPRHGLPVLNEYWRGHNFSFEEFRDIEANTEKKDR